MSGVRGFDSIRRALERFAREAPEALAAAVYQEGLAIEANATKRTPVDTGRLRATHYVTPPVRQGDRLVVEVGYGTEYAVYVHEVTDAAHGTGEAKFLEKAMNERASGYLERLARRAKKNVLEGKGMVALSATVPQRPQDPGADWQEQKKRERSERRAGLRAKRAEARKARRQARKARARARKDEARTRRRTRKAAQRDARKQRERQRRAEKRQRVRQRRDAARQRARERRRRQRDQAAMNRIRRRMQPRDFDF